MGWISKLQISNTEGGEKFRMQISTEVRSTSVEIPPELQDVFNLAQNMEGVVPRLPQIGIIHRGQMFVMPDESKIEKFEGIILDQHAANAWWEKKMSSGGAAAAPDCYSLDGITPDLTLPKCQSDKCANCKQNQFGSDGKGKACKNMKRLHILMEGSLLPRRLTVPPTSIRSFENYMTSLVDRGLPYAAIVSIFSLAKKTSETFEYAEVKFTKDRVLAKEELVQVANFIRQYKAARTQEIRAEEYGENTEEPKNQSKDGIPF